MANIKSAKKRAKQTVVRNARNTSQRSMLRTAVKRVLKALEAQDAAAAEAAYKMWSRQPDAVRVQACQAIAAKLGEFAEAGFEDALHAAGVVAIVHGAVV